MLSPARPSVVVGGALTLWGAIIGLAPLSDNSFLTHLATGRLILADGVPGSDPYSWTAAGEPWVVQSWLASALYAVVEWATGPVGLVAVHAATTAALAGLLWRLSRPAGSLIARIVAVAPALAVGAVAWRERPFLFAVVLLVVVLLAGLNDLSLDDPHEYSGPRSLALPVAMVALTALWAQLHGSWPVAIAIPAAIAFGRAMDGDGGSARRWFGLAGGGIGGGLVAAVGPLGSAVWTFPADLASRREILGEVAEWQPADFSSSWQLAFALQVVLAAVGVARRPSWTSAGLVVASLAGALLAVRNIAVGSVLLVAVVAATWRGVGSIDGRTPSPSAGRAVVLLAVVSAALIAVGLSGARFDLDGYPIRALARERVDNASGAGLVHPDRVGNVVELLDGTDRAVFVDDRFDMYPVPLLRDLVALERSADGWPAILDRYDADRVLWRSADALTALLVDDRGWRLVWAGRGWALLERR
ncbi:MAG TPA: hypothetical protein VGA13_10930 [Acidimicrobiales bacterium]